MEDVDENKKSVFSSLLNVRDFILSSCLNTFSHERDYIIMS